MESHFLLRTENGPRISSSLFQVTFFYKTIVFNNITRNRIPTKLIYRMSKNNFDEILNTIKHEIDKRRNHAFPIPPITRLAMTLRWSYAINMRLFVYLNVCMKFDIRYLATGSSQISLGLNYRISPSSVSRILRETLAAISDKMGMHIIHKIRNQNIYYRLTQRISM